MQSPFAWLEHLGNVVLNQLDHRLFSVLNAGVANPVLDWFMPRVTNLQKATWFVLCVAPLIVWILARWGKRGRTLVFCALLSLGLTDFTSSRLAKNVYLRDRPCRRIAATGRMAVPSAHLLPGRATAPDYVATPEKDCPGSSSFPSSHAANTMAFAGVCWWFTRGRIRWLWLSIPLLIGWSRIYLGYHFPGDVLAGWALGAALAWGIVHWLAWPILREQIVAEREQAADNPVTVTDPRQDSQL
jgi:undecaprenyl-diphosphatase